MDTEHQNAEIKKNQNTPSKHEARSAFKNDLLGAEDWKRSKFGYLTGLTPASRVISAQFKAMTQSAGRLALTFKLFTMRDEIPALPEVDHSTYDGKQRFNEAMKLHRMTEGKIRSAISNTRRSSYLYLAILTIAFLYFGAALLTKNQMPLTTLALHIAPIPIFSALALRALYYNWMFRNRSLEPLSTFFKSGSWFPK